MVPSVHLDTEVRRHQIVHTARKIVATQGMTSFTMQELAKDVGVSEGALYRHFRSKDDILLELVHEIGRTLLDAITDTERPKGGALDHLKHLFQRHFSSLERRNGVSFVVIAEALRFGDPPVKQAARPMLESYLAAIAAIVRSGTDRGEIDKGIDPGAAALMFFGMVQASVTLWSFSQRAHPLAQHSAHLWAMFEHALTPREGSEEVLRPGSRGGKRDSKQKA